MTQKTKFMKKILIALFALSLASKANAADLYKIDPTHASINWTANHYGFSNQSGKISDVSGSLTLDGANPQNSTIEVQIGVASLVTGMAKFDEHLKGVDFLNVAKFPTASFKSTAVMPSGKTFAKVKGDFTLLGITKNITLDVKLVRIGLNPINQKKTAGFYATTSIRRSDFGIVFGAPGVSDIVKIVIDLEANFVSGDNIPQAGAGPILSGYNGGQTSPTVIPEWKIIPTKSKLEFKGTHDKSVIEGSFKKFDGKIIFDKNQLSKSRISIDIDTTSVDISYAEAISTLNGAAWLSTKAFPKANFTSNRIILLSDLNLSNMADSNLKNVDDVRLNNLSDLPVGAKGDINMQHLKKPNTFRANGNLTIKGKSVPASIDFVLNSYSLTEASATGKLKINRSSFGVGDRDVKKANGIQDTVEINFTVSAER